MKCPHCLESFHAMLTYEEVRWRGEPLVDRDGRWMYVVTACPACKRSAIFLQLKSRDAKITLKEIMVHPKGIARAPLPTEVPDAYAGDYREACNVLADSPKASGALSRRCLQRLLREYAKVKPSDLSREIDEVLASKTLPADLADAIDAIRAVGNFAAHPIKSTNTGEIVDVEPAEAELLLDVLEDLFDFYFVRPARLAAKLSAVNKKLTEAGKPPLKEP